MILPTLRRLYRGYRGYVGLVPRIKIKMEAAVITCYMVRKLSKLIETWGRVWDLRV